MNTIMIRTVSLLVAVILTLAPSQVLADDAPKVTDVLRGDKAPFDGMLLNPSAAAQMIAGKEAAKAECSLAKTYVSEREKAKCDLSVNSISASLNALEDRHNSILSIKDEEIRRLNQLALEKPNAYNHWWFGGGIIVGIVTSVVIFYAAVEISK